MSAFEVSAEHINAIVHAWINAGHYARVTINGRVLDSAQVDDWQVFADALAQANHDSVTARYPKDPASIPVPVKVRAYPAPMRAVAVLKMLACFDYQSCEVITYEGSEVQRAVNSIRHAQFRRLDGWEDAAWAL